MKCSFLFINDRVWWMYMFVYTLYRLSMSVYGYVFVWKCKLCLPVTVWWTCVVLYICMNNCCICLHVWMAPGKISSKLTGSPSLNKVFELNWIEWTCAMPIHFPVSVQYYMCCQLIRGPDDKRLNQLNIPLLCNI